MTYYTFSFIKLTYLGYPSRISRLPFNSSLLLSLSFKCFSNNSPFCVHYIPPRHLQHSLFPIRLSNSTYSTYLEFQQKSFFTFLSCFHTRTNLLHILTSKHHIIHQLHHYFFNISSFQI